MFVYDVLQPIFYSQFIHTTFHISIVFKKYILYDTRKDPSASFACQPPAPKI